MKIRLPIKLTELQKIVNASVARFKLLKWGRRTGKTWYIAFWIICNALKVRGKHWYVTKTLSLGREELWPVLMDLLPRDLVRKTDERLLNIWLTNGSVISIKSGEKEDNLRGRGLASVVLDEAAFLKERLWDQILRPQLAHSRGPALIASSPKKGWFTRLFNEAQKNPSKDWLASHATIYDNPTIDPDEIAVIKAKTPNSTWRQEYMAEELANVGQVYDEFSPRNIYDPAQHFLDFKSFKTVVGIDYGIADPTGVAWVGVSPEGYLVVSTEHEQRGWDVARHSEVITTRSAGFGVQSHVLDTSAFRKEATSMTSIDELFRRSGIFCQRSDRDVQSSIDIIKRFVHGDGETPWLYVSSNCERTIDAFQNWEHGEHEPDILAAMRYASAWMVYRRMTRLADAIPTMRNNTSPVKQATADLIFAAQARIVPVAAKTKWRWDSEAGRPC